MFVTLTQFGVELKNLKMLISIFQLIFLFVSILFPQVETMVKVNHLQ